MTMQVHEPADLEIDTGKVVEAIVATGDYSRMTEGERGQLVVSLCRGLRLNPFTKPFDFIRMQGKLALYANRSCADQLAAVHRINRKLIRGPEVVDILGKKMVIAVCEATMPNGRVEQSTATCDVADACGVFNVLMKTETKAKRRATFAILGLAILDEMEVATVVEHDEMRPAWRQEEQPKTLPAPPPSKTPTDLDVFADRVESMTEIASAPRLWLDWAERFNDRARPTAYRTITERLGVMGVVDPRKWLKAAVENLRAQKPDNDPLPSGPHGGTRRAQGPSSTDASGSAQESHGSGDTSASVTALPGVPEWATTPGGVRAHLAGLDHVRHLENSARLHGARLGAAYTEPAAERLIALDGPDAHGSHLALSTARGMVTAWAEAGPRPKAETRKSGVGR